MLDQKKSHCFLEIFSAHRFWLSRYSVWQSGRYGLGVLVILSFLWPIGGLFIESAAIARPKASTRQRISSPRSRKPKVAFTLTTRTARTVSNRGTTVGVSGNGNILAFASPNVPGQQYEHLGVGAFSEGYVLCYAGQNAYDVVNRASGFGSASISGFTVTRSTADNVLKLTQGFALSATPIDGLAITMDVKNISSAPVNNIILRRQADLDVDAGGAQGWSGFFNRFARTSVDGVFAWNDYTDSSPLGREGHGLLLRAQSQTLPLNRLPVPKVTANILETSCNPDSLETPIYGDFGASLQYNIGTMNPGQVYRFVLNYLRF